ncbi:MAG TPA: hypothetical protein VLE48_14575 [Terriglobales bacterium]|nr:hypothetical protein [Terriglobales bacterium]
MLQQQPSGDVAIFAVWEPILQTDWAKPGSSVLARMPDGRVQQFWDPHHLIAGELSRSMKLDAAHPRPDCCWEEGVLWDLVAVYPQGAAWESSVPRAVYIQGPVVNAERLPQVLAELLGKPAE